MVNSATPDDFAMDPHHTLTRHAEGLARAAELIERAGSLVIAAGAGMGVDSGLPDFRGKHGFWRAYPALRSEGISFTEIATPSQFTSHPHRAWGFYGHRLALYRATQPHEGHQVLLAWCQSRPRGYTVFTSNVDGHFARAGFDPARIHECHGSIHHLQCTVPCSDTIWSADALAPNVDAQTGHWLGELPRCPSCGAVARPNILMFNDSKWVDGRSREQEDRQEAWLHTQAAPVVIEIGAGTDVPTVRYFTRAVVRETGGVLIRINPDAVPGDAADVTLAMPALEALRALAQRMR